MDWIEGLARFEKDPKLCKKILFLVTEWQRVFPDVDLKYEFASAHAWLAVKGEYKRDNARFLLNWIKRTQDRFNEAKKTGRPVVISKKYIEVKPQEDEVMDASDWKKLKEELVKQKMARRPLHESTRTDSERIPQERKQDDTWGNAQFLLGI